MSRSTHLLALVTASIALALASGFPINPTSFAFWDDGDKSSEFTQVNLPLPEPQLTAVAVSDVSIDVSILEPTQQQANMFAAVTKPATSSPYDNSVQPIILADEEADAVAAIADDVDVTAVADEEAQDWHTTTVKPGDNLTEIFVRLGLRPEKLYSLLSVCDEAKELEKVLPGQVFKIRTDDSGGLQELILEIDKVRGTRIFREGDAFKAIEYKHEIEKREKFAIGVVDGSLYQSALRAGIPNKVIMQLADIFSWDIDFAHDVRHGDAFTVIYEEDFFSGEKIGSGDIVAAEYINGDHAYRAIGFRNSKDRMYYYTPKGRSLKRAFMRNPVDFSRISSHFQTARWHPVLGKKRPHRGVDYAAATGTPVKASGDGKVIFVGKKGGYGKTIIIDHDRGYTTLYAHLSRYKKGLRQGKAVLQGQIIGYVGQTGLATGPHLHYEFRVNGAHKNPVTVKLPGAEPIPRKHLAKFKKHARSLTAQLDQHQKTRLALHQR